MTMNLIEQDKAQRQQALDPHTSFIVQAPAGSGKTELLIQRFLTLLHTVNKPEEILAITFTKKAANEMRLRIIKALKHAQSAQEPESSHAKLTWMLAKQALERDRQFHWNLIQNPNQLRIQTIDSLCAYLTKQLPLLSHFGSQPAIADSPVFLYREAVQEVLTHIEEQYEWSQALSQLLLHLDNDLNKLHDLLIHLLAKRDQWLPYIQFNTSDEEIRHRLEAHLAGVITDCLISVRDRLPSQLIAELMVIARFAADNLALANKASDISACRDLHSLPGVKSTDKTAWLGLARLLLTKSFSWRKRVDEEIGFPSLTSLKNPQEKMLHQTYRQRLTALITQLADDENLRTSLEELFYLPDPCYQDSQWEILKALLYILKIVAAQLRVTFQQHGEIDFIENAQAALSALGSDDHPTDLALALDYQIQHILIDEFQDTSFSQYLLLEKLISGWEPHDGRTLFVVGDPMQSIYRFREAEVGLFIRMRKNGIGNIPLIPLTLSVNFRSTSKVVEWNNTHFQKIFPPFNDMATGAVNYSPSVSHQASTALESDSAIVIKGFVDPDEHMQADQIVNLIRDRQTADPNEKIAILVRSRTHLSAIIPALKKAGLPFRAVDIDSLAAQQITQDLLSLTAALLHPADRISWLSVLRAPWCGLTLADLLVIAGEHPHAAIWEQLENPAVIKRLSPDGQQRLKRILPLLKSKIVERERYSLRFWVESTWLLLGGPACLQDYTEIHDVLAYFELLEEFSRNHPVLSLDKLKEKTAQLFASAHYDDANLQIMTIHAAKGLEFDTVILPHLERKMPVDDKSLLVWMEQPLTTDQIALLLAPIHATGGDKDKIYDYIGRQQRIKSNYEIERLFYVAATRAKKNLYLYFNVQHTEKENIKIESGSFLEKIWPLIEKEKEKMIRYNQETRNKQTETALSQRSLMRLSSTWNNPIQQQQNVHIAFHQQQNGFQLTDSMPKLIGIVAHRLLQLISERGINWWQEKNQQKTYLKHQLLQIGVLPAQLNAAIATTHNLINQAINDPKGRWILHAHDEAQSEYALTAIINGKPENLVIDRTFIDESGIRWIIDYKTTAFSQADLAAFLEKEQKKYLEKMHQYCQAMRLIEKRPIRLGLYFPALPSWKEWEAVDPLL